LPFFARIATETLKYLGVAATQPPVAAAPSPAPAAAQAQPRAKASPTAPRPEAMPDPGLAAEGPPSPIVAIPDFTGLSLGEALTAARKAGVRIEVAGSGRAVRQFPAPGRAMKSITCRVTFDPG